MGCYSESGAFKMLDRWCRAIVKTNALASGTQSVCGIIRSYIATQLLFVLDANTHTLSCLERRTFYALCVSYATFYIRSQSAKIKMILCAFPPRIIHNIHFLSIVVADANKSRFANSVSFFERHSERYSIPKCTVCCMRKGLELLFSAY